MPDQIEEIISLEFVNTFRHFPLQENRWRDSGEKEQSSLDALSTPKNR